MDYRSVDEIVADLVGQAVESEGCRLAELDTEGLIARVEGPDEVLGNCAKAVAEILD
jgi:hypothetical protein